MKIVTVLTLILLALPNICHAGKVKLGVSVIEGKTNSYSVLLKASETFDNGVDIYTSYAYGKSGGIVSKEKGKVGIGYDPVINDKWSLWFDWALGFNKVNNIDYESFVGFGPKYYIFKTDKSRMSFSTGVLYHHKNTFHHGDGRVSSRLMYKNNKFKVSAFHQPKIGDINNYIVKGYISFDITEDFEFLYEKEYRSIDNSNEGTLWLTFSKGF